MTIPWTPVTETVFNLLAALLGALLLALFALALQVVQQRVRQSWLKDALTEATRAAYNAAVFAEQTYVSEIRKAAEDRALTPEERQKAMQLALEYFATHAPVDVLKAVVPKNEDLGQWARSLIETQVPAAKLLVQSSQQGKASPSQTAQAGT